MSLCACAHVHLVYTFNLLCTQCVHNITQLTGSTVITAEFIVATEWTKKTNPPPIFCLMTGSQNLFPPPDWFPTWTPPIPLVLLGLLPGYIRSSYIWAEPWMFTAAFHRRTETTTYTHSRSRAHTHLEDTTECTQATHWLSCLTCWYWCWHLKVLNWDNLPTGSKKHWETGNLEITTLNS